MSQEAPTRVLRRTLEEALDTRLVSSLLFEALGAAGNRVPESSAEVLAVVRGPLRDTLERRLGAAEADDLVARLEARLHPLDPDNLTTQERPLDDLAEETRLDDATTAVPVADRAVRMLVLAAGRGFEHRVHVALGTNRVAASTVSRLAELERAREGAPHVLVVDATDFPPLDPHALIRATHALPITTVCVLWGAELPYGKNLARAMEPSDPRTWISLERREGIAPLLDLVRSRKRSAPAA